MRTTMNIPKDLMEEAVRLSGASTQTMAVVMGLEELIRKRKLDRLAGMRGSGILGLTPRDAERLRRR